MIKNLIFDFGKVLVDYDFEAFFRKYIPDTERCQAFTPVLYNEELQQLLDREERPFEVIMEEWIENHKEFEPEIYQRLFTKFNLKPEECIFTDDRAENIEGGKLLGNNGYCTEALQAMIHYCYEKKHFQTLWADFFVDNPASGRVMEKCGFTDTGKENYCSNLYHGEDRPVHIMILEKKQ